MKEGEKEDGSKIRGAERKDKRSPGGYLLPYFPRAGLEFHCYLQGSWFTITCWSLAVAVGSKTQAQMTVFLVEVRPMESKNEWVFTQAAFNDSGGLLHFLTT